MKIFFNNQSVNNVNFTSLKRLRPKRNQMESELSSLLNYKSEKPIDEDISKIYFEALQNIQKNNKVEINSSIPVDCPADFSDTKEFAKYLEYKIAKKSDFKTEEDIKHSVEKIATETNTDKQLVTAVMARLAQFSSYSQLNELSAKLKYFDIGSPKIFPKLCLNNVLEYVGIKKNQMNFYRGYKNSIFIDEEVLSYLEQLKSEKPALIKEIRRDNKKEFTDIVLIDGWNFHQNGKIVSYSMFGQEKSLEEVTKDVINKIKEENLSVDEALNGDCIKRLHNIFGDDINLKILSNQRCKHANEKTIADFLNPNMPNRAEIYSIINSVVDTKVTSKFKDIDNPTLAEKKKENNARTKLASYLDNELYCYSSGSLNQMLKEKYISLVKKVEELGKDMNDVLYYIPQKNKSYDLITYQYLKANNISFKNIICESEIYKKDNLKDKIIVILDDFSGTGQSLTTSGFDYPKFLHEVAYYPYSLIFSPILASETAEENVEKEIRYRKRTNKDFFICEHIIPESKITNKKILNNFEYIDNALIFDGFGYYNNASCVSFPYSSPDNNSGFGSLFARFFLSNKKSNGNQNQQLYGSNPNLIYGQDKNKFLDTINSEVQKYKD